MNSKPKILVFAHEQFLNGASHSLLTILIGLKNNFDFLVIIPEHGKMEEELIKNNINYKILFLQRCAYYNFKSFKDHFIKTLKYFKNKNYNHSELYKIVNHFKPDLIYTNTSVMSVGLEVAKKIKKPHIWHIREYGDIDFNIQYYPSKSYMKYLFSKNHKTIFTTKLLRKHWSCENKSNSVVIYNGVKVKATSKPVNSLNSTIKIGIVGMISESKGQLEAVKIVNNYNQNYNKASNAIVLQIYGESVDKHYYKTIQDYIVENDLNENVVFMGYVSNNTIYNDIDILLSCSKNEGFGRTIIEAMSGAIPVIAKNSGGPTEIIDDSINGFLYNDIEEASKKIDTLLSNVNVYKNISNEGMLKATTTFSEDKYIEEISTVFNSLVN